MELYLVYIRCFIVISHPRILNRFVYYLLLLQTLLLWIWFTTSSLFNNIGFSAFGILLFNSWSRTLFNASHSWWFFLAFLRFWNTRTTFAFSIIFRWRNNRWFFTSYFIVHQFIWFSPHLFFSQRFLTFDFLIETTLFASTFLYIK